jgi:hypothetical protein
MAMKKAARECNPVILEPIFKRTGCLGSPVRTVRKLD